MSMQMKGVGPEVLLKDSSLRACHHQADSVCLQSPLVRSIPKQSSVDVVSEDDSSTSC